MTNFKEVSTEFVGTKYEGGIQVFLESAEDVRIFSDHWFSHKQDKLRFVSAEGEQSGGGGCQVVINKVNEANANEIEAYGIVDRDVLLSDKNLALFWETDDETFHAAQPYGNKIYVLRRWELESYLLQPAAFSEEISKRIRRSPAPTISAETLLSQSDDIINVTALTTVSVANSKTSPNPGFGSQLTGTDLIVEIKKHLKHQFPNGDHLEISDDIGKIKLFDQTNGNSEEGWDRLSRILDGKKSLMRLCRYLSECFQIQSIHPWEEMRGCLADVIASKKLIDAELIDYIDNIYSIVV